MAKEIVKREKLARLQKHTNIACEYVITTSPKFFENMTREEIISFFSKCYQFSENQVGKNHILSSVIHFDEDTPHLHIVYLPVVEKDGKTKLSCSDFWKGYNSYGELQDNFHEFISKDYNIDRGEKDTSRKHLTVEEYKKLTNFEISKEILADSSINSMPRELLVRENKEMKIVLKKSKQYINFLEKKIEENETIKVKYETLKRAYKQLKDFSKGILLYLSKKLNIDVSRLINDYQNSINNRNREK